MKSLSVSRSQVFSVAISAAAVLAFSVPLFANAQIMRQLQFGMSGSDVTELQTYLASDSTLYPEGLVTGYYGSLTKAAVARFQTRNGISAVGRVGPATLPVINAAMANGGTSGSGTSGATISNVGTSVGNATATISFSTNENVRTTVYYSSAPLTLSESINDVMVSGALSAATDASMRTSHSVAITGLQANTTYYYMVYTTDADGNVSVTFPSTFKTNQ